MKIAHKKKKIVSLVIVSILIILLGSLLFVITTKKLKSISMMRTGEGAVSTTTKTLPVSNVYTRVANEKYYVSSIDIPLDNMKVGEKIGNQYNKWLNDSGILDIKTKEQAEKIGLSDTRKYEYEATLKVYDNKKYTSYVYEILDETGGAHPNSYHTIFNYRKSDGKEISKLTDLYLDNIYETLSKITRSDLRTQFMKIGGDADAVNDMMGDMFMLGTEAKEENFMKFYFKDKDTLTIVFDKYAIGPYALGDWDVDVPLSSISSSLR